MQQLEYDYYITPDGIEYSMRDAYAEYPTARWVESFAGQGMPPITYITQRGPFQHGETVLDYRLNARTITYIHGRGGCDRSAYWAIRADMLNHLRPNRQTAGGMSPGRLRKILPDGTKRDIDAWIMAGPEFAARQIDRWRETTVREALRFYCPDPTFYDPDLVDVDLTGGFCTGLIFPFEFPFVFCNTEGLVTTDSITYTGTWLAYPTITITGPLDKLLIRNITTDEKLEFDYFIPAGQSLTIDLAYGVKTVTDSTGTNRIGTLTTDSDLATWHLAADPEAPGGVNRLGIAGSSTVPGTTALNMRYYTRYIGI